MATSTAKSKRKSASTKSTSTKLISTKSTEPDITVLKKSSCPTLSQAGKIDYEISTNSNGVIHIGLTGNSGSGYFSKARQPVKEIINALEGTDNLTFQDPTKSAFTIRPLPCPIH
jgi:hypothetical protein